MARDWQFRKLRLKMKLFTVLLMCNLGALSVHAEAQQSGNIMNIEEDGGHDQPTVMVAILVRNKAHVLPYFLHYLEQQDYPKDRMSIWIRSDHNVDNSIEILQRWIETARAHYHNIDFKYDATSKGYPDEETEVHWSQMRFNNVIFLRQEALHTARRIWADYCLMLDADNILINNHTLTRLVQEKKPVIAPMLNCTLAERYANYWAGMDENGYYKREPIYFPILHRQIQGTYEVPMVFATMLIDMNLKKIKELAYAPAPPGYSGPYDDMIIFAHSAKYHGIKLYILNDAFYGWLPQPLEPPNLLKDEVDQFTHIRTEHVVQLGEKMKQLDYLWNMLPREEPSLLGFDQIYMVNLERRPDRRFKMFSCFEELGIKFKWVPAVDGKKLNDSYLTELGVTMLPGYSDPYHKRSLTLGEIGCFLSHYFIWQDMMENKYEKVIIFEDDIRFEPFFKMKLQQLMDETKMFQPNWELIYLGRKKLKYQDEVWVPEAEMLVWAHYSYWTLGYLLHRNGAVKLLGQNPLQKMVPIDEYIPIMFDKHPSNEYKGQFQPRDLNGLSVEPLLVFPTHYTGEPGYITDTENSSVIGQPGVPSSPLVDPPATAESGMNGIDKPGRDTNKLRGDLGDKDEL